MASATVKRAVHFLGSQKLKGIWNGQWQFLRSIHFWNPSKVTCHLDFAYTYKFHKSLITSLAEDWTVSRIKADQKNPVKADDPGIYKSRHQPLHTWATFCSTVSKAAPSVTCRSKPNSNFRLTYSTLDVAPGTRQQLPNTAGTLSHAKVSFIQGGLYAVTGWAESTMVQ